MIARDREQATDRRFPIGKPSGGIRAGPSDTGLEEASDKQEHEDDSE